MTGNSIAKNEDMRKEIFDLQDTILNMQEGDGLEDFPVTHHFAPGAYARQMLIPKDGVIVGKIHKHAHLNILSYGKVSVTTEEGNKIIEAPCIFTSPAGVKRAVYAIEDTLWTTIHVTKETDLEKIEDEVIAPSFEALEAFEEHKKIGVMP